MKNITSTSGSILTSLLMAMGLTPVGAHAQQKQASLEEVVVTATRREQTLQQVPVAVTAVSSEQMEASGIHGLSDIQAGAVPGVIFQHYAGAHGALVVSARGIAQPDGVQGTLEQPVPIYIDGVYFGRALGLGIDLIDPERIEVLRGPQGQLFGRNAEGGAIQFVTRKPSGEFGLKAKVSAGNYNYQRYQLAVDLPKMGGLSLSLAGLAAKRDGFTEQASGPQSYSPPSPQNDWAYYNSNGFRTAARWQSDAGDLTVDYAYDNSDLRETQPYPTWIPLDNGVPSTPVIPSTTDYPSKSLLRQYVPAYDTYASGHSLIIEKQLSSAVSLKSITAYRKSGRKGGGTLAEGLAAGVSSNGYFYPIASENVDQNQTSQEFQFIGTWDLFDLTAGALYYNEKVNDKRTSELSGPGLVGPVAFILPSALQYCVDFALDPCTTGETKQAVETDSYGVYAQGTYRPAMFEKKMELILGLRYTDDKKDAKRRFNLAAGGPVNQPSKFSENRVDPAFTVRYQWTDDLNTYLRYATGYRAGGVSVRSSAFESFGSEEVETWELGMKSRWFNTLQVNVALFRNLIKNGQVAFQESPVTDPSLQTLINLDRDKTIKGAEFEVTWVATDALSTGLNFTYMDADKTYDLDNPFDGTNTLYRYWQVQAPKTSGSVYLDYYQPVPIGSMNFHISYTYSDEYYNGDGGSTPAASLPADYHRPGNETSQVDSRLTWGDIPVGKGSIDLSLWVKNLTDDTKIMFGYEGCGFGGGFCTYRAEPRTYGIDAQYKY